MFLAWPAGGPTLALNRPRPGPKPDHVGPIQGRNRAETGPRQDSVRPKLEPRPCRCAASRRKNDDLQSEIIVPFEEEGIETSSMQTLQSPPMRLIPRRPPVRCYLKARPYERDVRRLRAEGHTLESIRLALLDVGVSVSVTTVRREAARPPSQWELNCAQEAELLLDQLQLTNSTLHLSPCPQLHDAISSQSPVPTGDKPDFAQVEAVEAVDDGKTSGVLSKVVEVLRGLWRARRPP